MKNRVTGLMVDMADLHTPPGMYTEFYLGQCPRCGSLDCEVVDEGQSGGKYLVEGKCPDCGARWVDEFVFADRTVLGYQEVAE